MPKGKNALLVAFGSPKAGEPEGDEYEMGEEDMAEYRDQLGAVLGADVTDDQVHALKEFVRKCVEEA